MKHCELCKVDFDETKPEEMAKHAHPEKGAEQQPSETQAGEQQGQQ